MAIQNRTFKKKKTKESTKLLSQAEIIKRINASTRKSYKLFEMLAWSKDRYEK